MRKLAAAIVLIASGLFAQTERGNITGIVSDPTGAAVAGAQVSVVNRDTNATARVVASSAGEYNVPNLLPGVYRIEVSAAGFKGFAQQNVTV